MKFVLTMTLAGALTALMVGGIISIVGCDEDVHPHRLVEATTHATSMTIGTAGSVTFSSLRLYTVGAAEEYCFATTLQGGIAQVSNRLCE